MSLFIFLGVLFVLILVHEWGHFIVAKKTGMRVDEFAIGFPPRLFGITRGETVYTLNALPIGGFVKIFGENPQATEENATVDARSFSARPRWAQALVLVAGVTMNVILAWVLFSATFMIGTPVPVDEAVAGDNARLMVSAVLPESPLAAVGVPPGAEIIALTREGAAPEQLTPSGFSAFVQAQGTVPLTLTYIYAGQETTVAVTPALGINADVPERPVVGASLTMVETVREPLFTALYSGALTTWNGLVSVTEGLVSLVRDAVVGEADLSQVAGPVGIVTLVGDAASYGIAALFSFTAIISLNLAVINMLPVPALDGGRLLLVGIEAVLRRPLNPKWTTWLNVFGFVVLMILMVVVTWNDVARLLS